MFSHLSIKVDVDPFIEGAIDITSSSTSEVKDGDLVNRLDDRRDILSIIR